MNASDRRFADMADRVEGRSDHDVAVAYHDRLTRSEGAFGRAWVRFNPGVKLVYVDDMEGHPRAVTPKQYRVLTLAMSMIDGEMMTMREMARTLDVAPSTVSRAMTKLASWGIIAYIVGRGRFAGLVIIRRTAGDGLDRFRAAAKARVRRWSEAAQRRVSRLWENVAPYILEGEGVSNPYYYRLMSTTTYKTATLKAWTAEDVAGIV